MPHIVEMAKDILRLPTQIGFPQGFSGVLDRIDDPAFATAAGLVQWGMEKTDAGVSNAVSGKVMEIFSHSATGTVDTMRKWMKKFLP